MRPAYSGPGRPEDHAVTEQWEGDKDWPMPAHPALGVLTAEQVATVRTLAENLAAAHGISPERAADLIARSLAVQPEAIAAPLRQVGIMGRAPWWRRPRAWLRRAGWWIEDRRDQWASRRHRH